MGPAVAILTIEYPFKIVKQLSPPGYEMEMQGVF
jgi:hypothetical protein